MLRGRALLGVLMIAGFGPAAQAHEPTARAVFTGIRADVRALGLVAMREESPSLPPHVVRDAPVLSEPLPANGHVFRYGYDAAGSHAENFRQGFSARAALKLKVAPVSIMNRTGWNWSGRLGPVRWLGPLDGEGGELMLRLQRIPDAPRPAGLGRVHISIHYTFE
jgi:hypothetical protein